MVRLSVTVDEKLVEEVRTLAHAKTKREAIELALHEFVRRRRLERLAELEGSDIVEWELEDLLRWRRSGTRELEEPEIGEWEIEDPLRRGRSETPEP